MSEKRQKQRQEMEGMSSLPAAPFSFKYILEKSPRAQWKNHKKATVSLSPETFPSIIYLTLPDIHTQNPFYDNCAAHLR